MRSTMNLRAIMAGKLNEAALGDEVDVKGADGETQEGTVKVPNGPGDTVGVLIDGELEMVAAEDVSKRSVQEDDGDDGDDDGDDDDALTEGLLGMSMMPSLARMQELAGIKPAIVEDNVPSFLKKDEEDESSEDDEDENGSEEDTSEDEDTGFDVEDQEDTDDEDEDVDDEDVDVLVVADEDEPSQEVQQAAQDMEDAVMSQQTDEIGANHPANEIGGVTMMSKPTDPIEDTVETPEEPEMTPEQVCLDAISKIENALPDIPVRQFSAVRNRLTDIMNAVMESSTGRQRKR